MKKRGAIFQKKSKNFKFRLFFVKSTCFIKLRYANLFADFLFNTPKFKYFKKQITQNHFFFFVQKSLFFEKSSKSVENFRKKTIDIVQKNGIIDVDDEICPTNARITIGLLSVRQQCSVAGDFFVTDHRKLPVERKDSG